MLETHVLLLRPAVAGQPRVIADAARGKPVGFARLQHDGERGWLGSLLGPILAVHEQEEEPLLFTVRRCFLWTQREVRDAEGTRVGYVRLAPFEIVIVCCTRRHAAPPMVWRINVSTARSWERHGALRMDWNYRSRR